ncbi:MAG: alanine--tRNA ligase-related protein [Candidatus Paceibacterota bacterium]|jgi:alanyl-tRNA synthetase
MKSYAEIKRHFGTFGFKWQDSVPIASSNPKLLFNISGGVVFEDAISNGTSPKSSRVVSVQTCLRTDGWEKIGRSGRHHLAFDMLGHFSLYEDKEAEVKDVMIESAWRYLTVCLGINPSTLSATVHPQDETSQRIWERLGVRIISNDGNVTYTPTRNRCGVRTEIVWQNPGTGKSMELWNLVFTQFQGEVLFESPLEMIAADSGASIDRIVTAVECSRSDYENSNWVGVVSSLTKRSKVQDQANMCRLADLGKAAVILVSQGLRPGNKAADYVLRKLIREAFILCQQASIPFDEFVMISGNQWSSAETVKTVFAEEVSKFEKGLERGRKEYQKLVYHRDGPLTESDIEYLASTFGFPKALIGFEEAKRGKGAL